MAEHTSTSSPAASAISPPAANKAPLKEVPDENKKRKEYYKCNFEVIRVLEGRKKGRYSLKVVKPLSSKINVNAFPTVCLKEERSDDNRAFQIMHNFKHKNILSMKLLAKNKMQSNDLMSIAAFVEPYDGKLWSICGADECADDLGHIPSPKFQRFISEIVAGIDFLIKNNLYHGNLTWESTFQSSHVVKLAGFKLKEPMMTFKDCQWNDVLCFRKMLEVVSERAHQINQATQTQSDPSSYKHAKYFCGTLDSLIDMIKKLDCTSLSTIFEIILEDPFFWNFTKRTRFFANTISLKLSDKDFMKRVRNSDICGKSWDKNGTREFQELVEKMNDHRESERKKDERNRLRENKGVRRDCKRWKPYAGNSMEHYVKCICGGYTHQKLIGVDIDRVVRGNHPSICIDMKRILDTADNLPSGSGSHSS